MKKCFLTFVVLPLRLFGADLTYTQQTNIPLPPHPTAILYQEGNILKPIVGVSGKKPQIEVDGKKQTLPSNKTYNFVRAPRYAPGRIIITEPLAQWNATQPGDFNNIRSIGSPVDLGVTFSAKITPTQSYKNCYFVLILENARSPSSESDDPPTAYFFRHIDNLAAGQTREIMIDLDDNQLPNGFHYRPNYFFLFFSDGKQIETNHEWMALAFFKQNEIKAHQKRIKKYFEENASADHPVETFLAIPPVFPPDTVIAEIPKSVEVNFTVGANGRVEKFEMTDILTDSVAQEIRRAVSAWLFLPALVAGAPQRTEIKIPVALRD